MASRNPRRPTHRLGPAARARLRSLAVRRGGYTEGLRPPSLPLLAPRLFPRPVRQRLAAWKYGTKSSCGWTATMRPSCAQTCSNSETSSRRRSAGSVSSSENVEKSPGSSLTRSMPGSAGAPRRCSSSSMDWRA